MFNKDFENIVNCLNEIFEKHWNTIADNEIRMLAGEDYSTVVAILKSKYNAEYIPPCDMHCCGDYCFKNPLCVNEKPILRLRCHYYGREKLNEYIKHDYSNDEEGILNGCAEIVRLDYGDIYWDRDKLLKKIKEIRKELICKKGQYFYFGENRVWEFIPVVIMVK